MVLEALKEEGIETESTLGALSDTVDILKDTASLSFWEKCCTSLSMAGELIRFTLAVRVYRRCLKHKSTLPKELELPFSEYAKNHHLDLILTLLKPFVAGFGYVIFEIAQLIAF